MTARYPRLRLARPNGRLAVRECLLLRFFMKRPHPELSSAVTAALDVYLASIGPGDLGWYTDTGKDLDPFEYRGYAGTFRTLDDTLWAHVREELKEPVCCHIELREHPNQASGFQFEYSGRADDDIHRSGGVSMVSFWLSTEWLEEQGTSRARQLAKSLARELPFGSGYASLAFNPCGLTDSVIQFMREHQQAHPTLAPYSDPSMSLGFRIHGVHWLNFYGGPVLARLGGGGSLRDRLSLPEISIEELGPDKVVVSLGESPEGLPTDLPRAYRLLSRELGAHLYQPRT